MAVAEAQLAWHLPRPGLPDQLHIILVDLPKPRCADRLAAGEASAISVDRQAAVDPRAALGDSRRLLAVRAEPVFGHVHYLGTNFRVLELRNVDVLRPDAGHLICRPGGNTGR